MKYTGIVTKVNGKIEMVNSVNDAIAMSNENTVSIYVNGEYSSTYKNGKKLPKILFSRFGKPEYTRAEAIAIARHAMLLEGCKVRKFTSWLSSEIVTYDEQTQTVRYKAVTAEMYVTKTYKTFIQENSFGYAFKLNEQRTYKWVRVRGKTSVKNVSKHNVCIYSKDAYKAINKIICGHLNVSEYIGVRSEYLAKLLYTPNLFMIHDHRTNENRRREIHFSDSVYYKYMPITGKIENEADIINRLQKTLPWTGKTIRRALSISISNYILMRQIEAFGIRHVNNVPCMAELAHAAINNDQLADFVKEMISVKGETWVAQNASVAPFLWTDTASMLSQTNATIRNIVVNGSYNISTMHDTISHALYENSYDNVEFEYSTEEMAYEFEKDGIRFVICKDYADLVELGYKMGICVGSDPSYKNGCMNRAHKIVGVYDGKNPIACAQINRDSECIQLRSKYNKVVALEYLPIFETWAEKNHIKLGKEWFGNNDNSVGYNYAHVRPEQIRRNNNRLAIIKRVNTPYDPKWIGENEEDFVF